MEYLLSFFIYSFLGWLMEVCVTFKEEKKFVNRGFLIGPYCPIYGIGCLLIIFFLNRYKDDLLVLFVMSIFLCGILEYMTSFLMEKLFHARWWDYSDKKFNINGRVCLSVLASFGILGCVMLRFIHPKVIEIMSMINPNLLFVTTIVITTLFIVDNIATFEIMNNIKNEFSNVKKDYTRKIRAKVNEMIGNKSRLHQRIIEAFPNYKMIDIRGKFKRKKKK